MMAKMQQGRIAAATLDSVKPIASCNRGEFVEMQLLTASLNANIIHLLCSSLCFTTLIIYSAPISIFNGSSSISIRQSG